MGGDMKELIDALQQSPLFDTTETALARAVLFAMRETFEGVVASQGHIWTYRLGAWHKLEMGDLLSAMQVLDGRSFECGENKDGTPKVKRVGLGPRKLRDIYESLLWLHDIRDESFFDEPAAGVSFQDGFVGLKGGKLFKEPHSQDHRCTTFIDSPIPNDDPPVAFLQLLNELFEPDEDKEEKIAMLGEFLGACIAKTAVKYACCVMVIGRGGNGKSVLLQCIKEMFDDDSVAHSSPARWSESYNLAMLQGKSINIVSELPETESTSAADLFKSVVSGDSCQARLPYQPPFTFRPTAGHIFAGNFLPSPTSGDVSYGFFRRWLLVPMNRCFTRESVRRDPREIVAKVAAEKAQVIFWALQSAANLEQRGQYQIPEGGKELQEEWRTDSDSVADFVVSCCELKDDPRDWELLSDTYDSYREFAVATGRRTMGIRQFRKRLNQIEVEAQKRGGQMKVGLYVKAKMHWADAPVHH